MLALVLLRTRLSLQQIEPFLPRALLFFFIFEILDDLLRGPLLVEYLHEL